MQCKGIIKGPSCSYIVCRTTGCYNGMSHFGCLGFPGKLVSLNMHDSTSFTCDLDVSTELAKEMKGEFECPSCFTRRENAALVVGSFSVDLFGDGIGPGGVRHA